MCVLNRLPSSTSDHVGVLSATSGKPILYAFKPGGWWPGGSLEPSQRARRHTWEPVLCSRYQFALNGKFEEPGMVQSAFLAGLPG
jgi:hypothetical protein